MESCKDYKQYWDLFIDPRVCTRAMRHARAPTSLLYQFSVQRLINAFAQSALSIFQPVSTR